MPLFTQASRGTGSLGTLPASLATNYGAIPDAKMVADVTIAQGSTTLNSPTANFAASDVGKSIKVYDIGTWTYGLRGTITAWISPTRVTVSTPSPVNMLSGQVAATWGTDNTAAIQAALDDAFTKIHTDVVNVNNPIGAGIFTVDLPITDLGDKYLLGSPINVPRNVRLTGDASLYNGVGNGVADTTYCINVLDGGNLGTIILDCAHGTGITCGTSTGDAHAEITHLRLWNVGNSTGQKGLQILGFDYDIGHVWIKGGAVAVELLAASDCHFDTVYIMGAQTAVTLNGCQNINVSKLALDTISYTGVQLDTSHHIHMDVMAFNNYDGTAGTKMLTGLLIGEYTQATVSNIHIDYAAAQTGGRGLSISHAVDSTFTLKLSDALMFSNTTGTSTFDKGITYGVNNAGFLDITLVAADTLPLVYEGTKYGTLSLHTDTDTALLLPGNLGINTATQFGSGNGVVSVANATTVPSTNPVGAFILYAVGGVPTFRFSSGQILSLSDIATNANVALALNPAFTGLNKKIVLFGSSTAAGVGSSDWHGTPNNQLNAVSTTSWGGMFATAMAARGFTVVNQSIGGTFSQTSIDRFYTDVAPLKPRFVILATSFWNEPNITTDSLGAIKVFIANTYKLCQMVEAIGAIPVLIGPYSSWMRTPLLYGLTKGLYPILERLSPMVFNFLSATDEGTGTWLANLTVDYTHPNDLGHLAFYNSVPLGFFEQLGDYRVYPLSIPRAQWQLNAGDTSVRPLSIDLDKPARSWTFSAKVRATVPATAKVYLSIGNGATSLFRVRNPTDVLTLTDGVTNADLVTSTVRLSDFAEHSLVVTYHETLNKVTLYIDGVSAGNGTPSFALTPVSTFSVAGKNDVGTYNAVNHVFKDVGVWYGCLSAEDISDMYKTDRLPTKSMVALATLSHAPYLGYAQNAAPSTTLITTNGNWSKADSTVDAATATAIATAINGKYDKTGGVISTTWTNSGTTYSLVTANAVDTASASGSLLEDLQVNGVSKFSVTKRGDVTANGITIGTGAGNIASNLTIGAGSFTANISGADNVSVGSATLQHLTTAINNTAVGNNALTAITTGSSNVGVGMNTLSTATLGYQNTAVGKDALKLNVIGNQNTALGNSALLNNRGDMNTAFGFQSLQSCSTGTRNTGVGITSLSNVTTGTNNVGIGLGSGNGIIGASYNVVIGSYTGSISTDNNVVIADGQGNERFRVPASGNLLLGTVIDMPSALLNMKATDKGVLLPRLSQTQRDAIVNPEAWLCVINTTVGKFSLYTGTQWVDVGSASADLSQSAYTNISGVVVGRLNSVNGSIGIGSTNNATNTQADVVAIGTNAAAAASSAAQYVAIGAGAGKQVTSGTKWVATGYQAGYSNINGNGWIATGVQAGYSNTTGGNWIANGYRAGYSNTTGGSWIATGVQAGYFNTTGSSWIATGFQAGYSNTSGNNWIANGHLAGRYNTTGGNWVATGYSAGFSNTTGDNWIATGYATGYSSTTGSNWIATGFQAGYTNATGNGWIASGYQAGYFNTSGNNWIATGYQAGYSNINGNGWIANGHLAGCYNTTGSNWIATGYQAARSNTTGSNWIATGYAAGYDTTTAANFTMVGSNTGRGITTGNGNTIIGANVVGLPADLANNIILSAGNGLGIPVYADRAAAIAGGLTTKALYASLDAGTGEYIVKVVV